MLALVQLPGLMTVPEAPVNPKRVIAGTQGLLRIPHLLRIDLDFCAFLRGLPERNQAKLSNMIKPRWVMHWLGLVSSTSS